ncbi:PE family protein [Mycobacterium sp. 050134]|uniref:PE family protein n=1 Tax=Mycobacterium sp. 050134 TaxID=3096111 RepID=UPI002ED782FB
MSFVVAVPDEVQAAAQNLANLREAIAEASSSIAGPTTGVVAAAQDQVSAAVAAMFGTFGQEYQVLNVQAQAFHDQFVGLLNAGAGAYLGTDVANAQQSLVNAVSAPVQGIFGQAGAAAAANGAALTAAAARPAALLDPILGGATVGSSLLGGLGGGSVGASINGAVRALESGNPLLLLSGAALPNVFGGIPGLPATLQSLESALLPQLFNAVANPGVPDIAGPYQTFYDNTVANLQAFSGLWSANPAPLLRQFIDNQIAYGQLVATSFQHAANDFGAGVVALPSAFQAAFQALVAGDVTGAVTDIGKGFANLFFSGLEFNTNGTVTVLGALGDLLPIAAIPGDVALNFSNVVGALTDANISFSFLPPSFSVGLPLALALDAIGAPVTTLSAFASSANAFAGALQTGNALGAAAALIDAPAVVANGFLNGQQSLTLELPTSLSPIPFTSSLTATIPLGGLLVPLQPVNATAVVLGNPTTIPLAGTEFGGLIPGLYSGSMQLADAITLG